MDFREALQAGKIGIGGASDHWSRLFAQKVLGGYVQGYAEGAIASFNDGAKDAPVDKLLVEILPVQPGTGDPSPENIRPISGWTGANVVRSGENIFDKSAYTVGSITFKGPSGSVTRSGILIDIPEGTYKMRCFGSTVQEYIYGYVNDDNGNYKSSYMFSITYSGGWRTQTVQISRGDKFYFVAAAGGTTLNLDCNLKIVSSDTIGTYSPYTGTTYPITFPSEAGTVYGGELDVTSGVLTVTYANIASYNGETINEPWLSSMDKYVAGATPTTGAQVVYPLTTPLTYHLTPTEVTTLLGVNNIWADTGDVKVWYKKKR